jgi:hypothetical protein
MTTVNIHPLPEWARKYPQHLWPGHPPIFTDGEPTEADRDLARELFAALDGESQDWYGSTPWLREPPKPPRPEAAPIFNVKDTTMTTSTPASDTRAFDKLTDAVGGFLDEVAEKARRENPVVHVAVDAALKSGETYTLLTVKLLPGGIQVRAAVHKISDGAEIAVLDEVSGVVARPMQ